MSESKIFIYVALPCEAKPLVSRFKLKKHSDQSIFPLYSNKDICLTVTGLGKSAMAAGVAFTQALFLAEQHSILLNVGVAGHKWQSIGEALVVEKINDMDSGRRYYPPLVIQQPCATESLCTFSVPQLEYRQEGLYDMEASAFYETAMRFTSAELIQLIKVVSDNQKAPADNLTPKQVSALIQQQLPVIEQLINRLKTLAGTLSTVELSGFDGLIQNYHFTVTEQNQLKALLARWTVLSDQQKLAIETQSFKKAKDVLIWLEQQINQLEFFL